ncbi:MAG: hypothetical protein GY832_03715 [Chloroflexi bacterium]|nr:hypothetical protein [Chloroflexota bacterium]
MPEQHYPPFLYFRYAPKRVILLPLLSAPKRMFFSASTTATITVSDDALSAYKTFVLTAGPMADSYIFLPLVLRNS